MSITKDSSKSQAPNSNYLESPYRSLLVNSDTDLADHDYIRKILEFAFDTEQSTYCEDQIEHLVEQIKYEQLSYVRLGLFYWDIKSKKLYKETHTNFRQWCEEIAGRTHWSVNQYIRAADITLTLIMNGFDQLPHNVSQCEILAKLPHDDLVIKWQKIIDACHCKEITASKIESLLFPPEPSKLIVENNIKLMPSVYEQVVVNACKVKQTVSNYISNLIETRSVRISLYTLLILMQT